MATPNSVRFIYIYRGYILYRNELRIVRFDSWVHRIDPHQYYQCVDINNMNIYDVLGSNILDYFIYNIRPLTKFDPEFIHQPA